MRHTQFDRVFRPQIVLRLCKHDKQKNKEKTNIDTTKQTHHTQMEDQIKALQNLVTQQQAQLQQLHGQLQDQIRTTNQIGNQSTTMSRLSRRPQAFTGDDDKINVVDWLAEMDDYMRAAGISGSDVMPLVFTYLGGAAGAHMRYLRTIDNTASEVNDFDAFSAALTNRFSAVDRSTQARHAVVHSTQKGTVATYTRDFVVQLEYCDPPMGEADAVFHYLGGLKPQVQTHVRLQGPSTLQAAMKAATQYEFVHSGSRQPVSTSIVTPQSIPMDVSAAIAPEPSPTSSTVQVDINQLLAALTTSQSRPNTGAWLNNRARGRGRGRGRSTNVSRSIKCYQCQGFGHYARDCPTPRSKDVVQAIQEIISDYADADNHQDDVAIDTSDNTFTHVDDDEDQADFQQ